MKPANDYLRYLLFGAAFFLSSFSASATDYDRNVAGKLTDAHKTQVRVMSAIERTALSKDTAVLDLDVDPNQILCRQERVGPSSRLTKRRCKTRAEFRREDNKNRMHAERQVDDARRIDDGRALPGLVGRGLRVKAKDSF